MVWIKSWQRLLIFREENSSLNERMKGVLYMKKRIRNLIGYICAMIVFGEYTFGMMKGYCTGDKMMMAITTVVCMVCIVLIAHYMDEEA